MKNLPSSLRFWITLFIGVPLIALLVGLLIYWRVGADSQIWQILSTIAPTASVLATMSLALAALIGIITNIRMVSEMEKTRKAQTSAFITAYFDNPISTLIDLVVKNDGYGTARQIRLKIAPPLFDHENRDISELSLFKRGIEFFPPNREFRQIVGTSQQFFGEGAQRPLEYMLTITYLDLGGNSSHEQLIPLDLSVYRNLPIHRESDVDKLTKEVEQLRKVISELLRRWLDGHVRTKS